MVETTYLERLEKDYLRIEAENEALKRDIYKLQTFKDHADFILEESIYQQIEEETDTHLAKEKSIK